MLRVPQARRDMVCSVPSWARLELFPLRVLPGYVWWSHHRGHRLDPQARTSRAGLPRPSAPEGFSAGCSRKPRSCHLVGSRGPSGGAESLLSSLQVSAGRWHRPTWSSVSDEIQVQVPRLTWRKWRLFSEQLLHCIHHVHGLYLFGWFLFTSEFGTHGMTEDFVYLYKKSLLKKLVAFTFTFKRNTSTIGIVIRKPRHGYVLKKTTAIAITFYVLKT